MRYLLLIISMNLYSMNLLAQETYLDQSKEPLFHQITEAYDNALYGRAIDLANDYIAQGRQLN